MNNVKEVINPTVTAPNTQNIITPQDQSTTRVLASSRSGDLVEGYLAPGQSMVLAPPQNVDDLVHVFFIVEGKAELEIGGRLKPVNPKEFIVSDTLASSTTLRARGILKYLHFSLPSWYSKNSNEGEFLSLNSVNSLTVLSRESVGLMCLEVHMGESFFNVPDDSESLGIYYVASGVLTVEQDEQSFALQAGAVLDVTNVKSKIALFADTPVNIIYFADHATLESLNDFHNELYELAVEVEKKDGYTSEHCLRLQQLSMTTGRRLGLSNSQLWLLNYGAKLHDLGKVQVPIEILQKPGKLTDYEWTVIKAHPTFGREMLEGTPLEEVGSIVEQHHERLDGSGYPYGLKNDEVLIESYIVAVADTFDAMTTDRSYRKALPVDFALEEIESLADEKFPKEVTDAFIESNS